MFHRLFRSLTPLLAATSLLAGCSGVVKNLNSTQVKAPTITVDNALGLGGQTVTQVPATGTTPAVQTYPFPNQSPINQADVQSATLALTLNPAVTIAAPAGTTLPATFTLSSLSLTPQANKLGTGGAITSTVTLSPLTLAAPVTFTQTASGTYTASAPLALSQATPTAGADVQTLVGLITSGADSNQAVLTISAASTGLPDGSTLDFTVGSSQISVRTGS